MMRSFLAILTFAVLGFALAGPSPVAAQQDISNLLNRIDRLEREIVDLQRALYAAQPSPRPQPAAPPAGGTPLARIELRLQQIEDELRSVTGQAEELAFGLQQVADRLDRVQADTDIRFRELVRTGPAPSPPTVPSSAPSAPAPDLEGGPVAAAESDVFGKPPATLGTLSGSDLAALSGIPQVPAEPPAPAAAPAPPPVLPEGSVQDRYEAAFNHLVKHDLDRAEVAFKAFLDAHGEHPLAGNAQYWLGETYYARERHDEAAIAFAEGYQRYPESAKAPDNLLKLGMSLARIGKLQEACTTFTILGQQFPAAPTNIKRRLANELKTLECEG